MNLQSILKTAPKKVFYIVNLEPCMLYLILMFCILYHTSCILYLMTCILCLISWTLYLCFVYCILYQVFSILYLDLVSCILYLHAFFFYLGYWSSFILRPFKFVKKCYYYRFRAWCNIYIFLNDTGWIRSAVEILRLIVLERIEIYIIFSVQSRNN